MPAALFLVRRRHPLHQPLERKVTTMVAIARAVTAALQGVGPEEREQRQAARATRDRAAADVARLRPALAAAQKAALQATDALAGIREAVRATEARLEAAQAALDELRAVL